jgi:DNA-directed RNA polymerase specialized sigma24 family protein
LAAGDERESRVVELRFFGGLSLEETAAVLTVSPETVMRDWQAGQGLAGARAEGVSHERT